MLATLDVAGLTDITLDLGHVGVCEAVLATAGLDEERESLIFDALQRKSLPDLQSGLAGVDAHVASLVTGLVGLHGDASVLNEARELYAEDAPAALAAVDAVDEVARQLLRQRPHLNVYFDLAELRGYHYHTGIVFAAYAPGHGQALANGGRYDHVGAVFGRARAATGFATDLKAMLGLLPPAIDRCEAISAPVSDDPALAELITGLRDRGEIVINCLSATADKRCTRELVLHNGEWQVRALPTDE
jgi:ATP phosphoribosyltransferase regulatory subunit